MSDSIHKQIWNERYRLAKLSQDDVVIVGLLSLMLGLIFAAFHFFGNGINIHAYGRSAFTWMVGRWSDMGGDFSHGWLIPIVSVGVVWYKKQDIINAPKQVNKWGLALVILALLMHWMGVKAQQTRFSLMAFILLVWATPFYLCGWQVAKLLIFPCAYLIFMIPLNFLDTITVPLRIMATTLSAFLLNGLGVAVQQTGTAIISLAGEFQLDVAAPCSGLRSLLALTALTAVYAYLTQKTVVKKWVLFLCSIPLAIIGNVARIATLALMANAFGQKFALGLAHDYSGYIVFSVAIILMIVVGGVLSMNYHEIVEKWKQEA